MTECECGNKNIEKSKDYRGNLHISHNGYSGVETIDFYSCKGCQKVYSQARFFDPFDQSEAATSMEECPLSREELGRILQINNIKVPMGVTPHNRDFWDLLMQHYANRGVADMAEHKLKQMMKAERPANQNG